MTSVQRQILSRRAGLIRLAIILSILSVLLAGILIIALFLAALFGLKIGAILILLFVGCMGSLISSQTLLTQSIDSPCAGLASSDKAC